MIKNIFYRGMVLASELGDALQHLHRWRKIWSTPARDRVLDMYALEDRVLFNIAPIMNAAALQAAAGAAGTGIEQNPQAAMPAANQLTVTVQHVQAGQDPQSALQSSHNELNNSTTTLAPVQDHNGTANQTESDGSRHVNFALIDNSLQDIDRLISSLEPDTEVYLFDHRQESPTNVLNTISDWAKTNQTEIDSLSILSHGASGRFILGNQWLTLSNLCESADAWQKLGGVMTEGGKIDIFACNLAAGANGQDLIDNIGRLSGTTVFASINDTGRGADWVLEAVSTTANTSAWHNPLDAEMLGTWKYVLAPGITVTPTSGLSTTEAGVTATFSVVLDALPTDTVTIGISSADLTEGTVSTSLLTFTTADWNVAKSVTVTGVDDLLADGNILYSIITAPAVSNDAAYNGRNAADVSATNIDNGYNTIYVDSTGDIVDGTTTSIAALYGNKGADGKISLREAILAANATTNGSSGADRIYFNMPGSGLQTIVPTSILPNITDAVIIDGYTQSGASANTLAIGSDAVLTVELNGSLAGSGNSGLTLAPGSSGSTIRGLIINRFQNTGIGIVSNNNIIAGNFIGTNSTGTAALGNIYGVYIFNGQSNTIGGTTAGARNIISGNAAEGVYFNNANYNTILGNYIGTNAAGTAAIANNVGVYSYYSSNTIIGGTAAGARNVISGNSNNGILMEWCVGGNVIQGNYIGADSAGTGSLANNKGILVTDSIGVLIGGIPVGAANVISYNSGNGVTLSGDSTTAVRVLGNSIHSNGGLGIDLGNNGLTANDSSDADSGPNSLQNFPVLTAASINGGNFRVEGYLNTTANTSFRIEVFANSSTDPSGFGEGQRYLGAFDVTTDATGNISFEKVLNVSVVEGERISATVTNLASNNTSEFAQCYTAIEPGIILTPGASLTTTEDGGQAAFSVRLKYQPTADVAINLSSSDLRAGTLSTGSLLFTTENWNVDQNVTVTGVGDTIIGNIAYSITFAGVSSDINYNGITPSALAATNIDNDTYNTIYVDTISDVNDGNTSSLFALYYNKGADGKISLREAMLAANNTANGPGGPDRISFDLPDGSHTITVASQLSSITSAVIIDAGTDSHYAGAPMIELRGIANTSGFVIPSGSDGSTIRGFVINNFGYNGVLLAGNYNTIANCYIGTDITGTTAIGNTYSTWTEAVRIEGNYNTVGGTTVSDRNVISGNFHAGVWIPGDNNIVQGNYVGVDVTGNNALANRGTGVGTDNYAEYNNISNNVISCNGYYNNTWGMFYGMEICGAHTTISNNIVGLSAAGNRITWSTYDSRTYNGNVNDGMGVRSAYNTITGNVVSGNTRHGINLSNSSANYNTIQGNYVGLSLDGATAIGNGQCGINVNGTYNTIGGTTLEARNVISGNSNAGVWFAGNNNTLQGNYIGTDSTGTIALGNVWRGVTSYASNNLIGGTQSGAGNLIAYNASGGVEVNNIVTGNQILGNLIYGNSQLGIDLGNNNISANDLGDSDTGSNNLQNYPVLFTATSSNTQIHITGNLNSTVNTNYRIECFANTSADPLGYGEGQRYLGFANVTTDASGNATINATFDAIVAEGEFITATATNLATNDTSEFSQNIQAHTAGIVVTPITLMSTTEFGGSAQFAVVLNAAPSADVTVAISSDNTNEGVVSTSLLTFTTANWNVAQTVTVTGVDDFIIDGGITYSIITAPASSTDTIYNGINASDMVMTNVDNESPGITVTPSIALTTTEDGGQATFTVRLNCQPTADVTVNLSSSDLGAGTLSTGSLVFTSENWNVDQSVTVTGVNDTFIGNVAYSINFVCESSDSSYNGLTPPPVAVTNIDNDTFNTIYVDTNSDVSDGDTSSIVDLIYNKGADGQISLREVMLAANNTANGPGGPDRIHFNLPDGSHTIVVAAQLPSITNAVIIDASTDSHFSDMPVVEIKGIANTKGLVLDLGSDGSTIRGLVINNFGLEAIEVNTNNNTIAGCYIGTDATGTFAAANTYSSWRNAIALNGNFNTIGGSAIADRNVISGNTHHGIWTMGDNNVVKGNYLGVNAAGNGALGNGCSGVGTDNMADGNLISGNVISGNGIINNNFSGVEIRGTNTTIVGNYIGISADGTNSIGNRSHGIVVYGSNTTIGGTTAEARNIISGNLKAGVWLEGNNNTVQGNYVGTDPTGLISMGNTWCGITSFSSNHLIGGTQPGAGNLVAFNLLVGVEVSNNGTGNRILGNSIYANSRLGIDINYNYVTPNDLGDGDTGSNSLQNFPVLSSASTNGTQINIVGSLNSAANTTFRIEFFANSAADDLGYGEGQRYLGYSDVLTDASGNVSFVVQLAANVPDGESISATATNLATNDTSEFAQNVQAKLAGLVVTPITDLTTSEYGATAQFTVVLNAAPTADVTIAVSSNNTNEGTVSTSLLTFTTQNWNIAQTVTVTGVDDIIEDGAVGYSIVLAPADSSDSFYNGLDATDLLFTNIDNETAGFAIIPPNGLITTENGGQATFSVQLNRQPAADVTIHFSSSNTLAGTLPVSSLTFTSENWNTAQTVTITGGNDYLCGNTNYTINFTSVVSADPDYNGLTAPSLAATNIDNDTYNTIYVDTISDVNDGNTSSLFALYYNKGADGKISLREAMLAANNTANGPGGPDRISFDLPDGSHTITVASQLSSITSAVIIDAGTDSHYAGAPMIELRGIANTSGFVIPSGSDGSTIRGFVINNFGYNGVLLAGNYNTIANCYIGTDITGTTAIGNTYSTWTEAVRIEGNYNTVGGTTVSDRNVISGNFHAGVWIPGDNNIVQGNYVGVDVTGNNALANRGTGVGTDNYAEYNNISNNVISCNGYYNNTWGMFYGMEICGAHTTISNNIVGLSAAGNRITWSTYDSRTYNGNVNDGIGVRSSYNTITGNVVSGNTRHGINLLNGDTNYNTIQGNYFGLSPDGTTAIGNGQCGINVNGTYNTIGGTTVEARNVISGNSNAGVWFAGNNNTLQGNYIGTDSTGTIPMGNAWCGVTSYASNNLIGGTQSGAGNLVAYNGTCGVEIYNNGTGNQILGNSIYGNSRLGIDLGYNFVSANDSGDGDTGSNNQQNFPVLFAATTNGSQVHIAGSLNSIANTSYRIEFFTTSSPDSLGYGEGQLYLGYVTVTTDAGGNASFTVPFAVALAEGDYITATATNLSTNDTSEFAQNVQACIPGIIVTPLTDMITSEDGVAAQFSVVLRAAPASDVTIAITSDHPEESSLSSSLLTFTSSNWNVAQIVTINGLLDYLTDGTVPYNITISSAVSGDINYNNIDPADLLLINTDHVNCAPVLTVPARQTIGSSLIFAEATANAIRVDDFDSGNNAIHIVLTAANGQLTLANTAGLTFNIGDGSADDILDFVGSVADINNALEGMRFASMGANGTLDIAVDDNGSSGIGGEQSSTANLIIQVVTPPPPSSPPPILILTPYQPLPSTPDPITPSIPLSSKQVAIGSNEQTGSSIRSDMQKECSAIINGYGTSFQEVNIIEHNKANEAEQEALSIRNRTQVVLSHSSLQRANHVTHAMTAPALNVQLLWKAFDAKTPMGEDTPWLNNVTVGTAIGLGAGLSVGYLVYGALLTSTVATLPMCHMVDPLPILDSWEQSAKGRKPLEKDGSAGLEESLESLVS